MIQICPVPDAVVLSRTGSYKFYFLNDTRYLHINGAVILNPHSGSFYAYLVMLSGNPDPLIGIFQ